MDPAEKPRKRSASDLSETPRPRLHRQGSLRSPREWRFQTGKVLGTAISVWWSRLIPFSVLTAIVFSPYIALEAWGNLVSTSGLSQWWWEPLGALVSQLLTYAVSAAVIYGVFQRLRGRPVSLGKAVGAGLSRLPAVLLVALVMLGLMMLCFLPVVAAALTGHKMVTGLAWLACLVLAAFVNCALFVAVAACVVERPGIFASLRRSFELTRGFRLQIFVIVVAIGVSGWLVGAVFGGMVGAIIGVEFAWAAMLIGTLLIVSISAVVTAVTYHDLRIAVDGMDADQLAAIFD